MKLYKNASLQATLAWSNPQHTTDNSHPDITLEQLEAGTGNPIEEYKGIDDLAIWQTALNHDQIYKVYNRGLQPTNTIYFQMEHGCPNATVGDVALINGTVYTAVTIQQFKHK